MEEIWRNIDGYDNYQVSNLGQVRNSNSGQVLRKQVGTTGYHNVYLYKQGSDKCHKVHRLVGMAFIDNSYNKRNIDHANNNKLDNRVENLRWCTDSENNYNLSKRIDNTSGCKGISFNKKCNKWHAYINVDGERTNIGLFRTLEEAKIARLRKANELFGVFVNACEN